MNSLFKRDSMTEKQIIPLSVSEIRGNELKYVKECLDYRMGLLGRAVRRAI